ncbi:MAG: sigma 54-interacting transcriptional regulator [Myxococcales bacterium]|nr:sigma 54-interacting transcriptional regulator [Myxococcales bacterium]
MAMKATISEQEASNRDVTGAATWLVRVGSAAEPLTEPQIYPLEESVPVHLCRHEADVPQGTRCIATSDRWMSSQHVEVCRTGEGWRLSDLGSSNGTLTWGRRRSTTLLANGDVFETGSTFWLFRSELIGAPFERGSKREEFFETVSLRMKAVYQELDRMATSRIPLVIRGPIGSGKEVFAREAHRISSRSGRFVPLDAGTIAPKLVAHELFGVLEHADVQERARQGRLRLADRGTLFIDQLEDIAEPVQLALLRAVQTGEIVSVGSDEPEQIDVRFIASTRCDLKELVESRGFRPDLASRLKGLVLAVPSLKERLEDLGLLIGHFLRKVGLEHVTFSPAAYRALMSYGWPGNIRELMQTLESSVALCEGNKIELADLPVEVQSYQPPEAVEEKTSDEHRERELTRLLTAHRGNVSAVARSMGYSRMQVHRWMKQMRVNPNDYRT